MAKPQVIKLVQGDTRPTITLDLYDDNNPGEFLNISGATVYLKIRELDIPGITDTLTGTVIDGLIGRVAFDFDEETLLNEGDFEAEVEVNFSSGAVHTAFDKLYLVIREQH